MASIRFLERELRSQCSLLSMDTLKGLQPDCQYWFAYLPKYAKGSKEYLWDVRTTPDFIAVEFYHSYFDKDEGQIVTYKLYNRYWWRHDEYYACDHPVWTCSEAFPYELVEEWPGLRRIRCEQATQYPVKMDTVLNIGWYDRESKRLKFLNIQPNARWIDCLNPGE